MEEKQVTIGDHSFSLSEHHMVIATGNPEDNAGTYPLPYAQKDRFLLQSILEFPSEGEEIMIMK
jgi:MoxR-like ATPase